MRIVSHTASLLALLALSAPTMMLTGPAAASSPTRASVPAAAGRSTVQRADLFAIDQDHHTVVMVSANGAKKTVVGGLTNPVRIAVDKLEDVYVVDIGSHRLIKATQTGHQSILRTAVSDTTSMALDYRNNLYVLDGPAAVKYPAGSSTPTVIGTAPPGPVYVGNGSEPQLTSDWAGNVSISYATQHKNEQGIYVGVWVKTILATGGAPSNRKVNVGFMADGYFDQATEGWDGSMYEQLGDPYTHDPYTTIVRTNPGSSQGVVLNTDYTEFAYSADHHGNFYLMQNRQYCTEEEGCYDDYAVDSILEYAPKATKPTIRPISGLQLPLGGLAIDDSGTIYGAILLSPRAYRGDSRVHPELVRIDPGATTPIVLAVGHFSMPTVTNHYCAS